METRIIQPVVAADFAAIFAVLAAPRQTQIYQNVETAKIDRLPRDR